MVSSVQHALASTIPRVMQPVAVCMEAAVRILLHPSTLMVVLSDFLHFFPCGLFGGWPQP